MESTIKWKIDISAALSRAQNDKKQILLYFFKPGEFTASR